MYLFRLIAVAFIFIIIVGSAIGTKNGPTKSKRARDGGEEEDTSVPVVEKRPRNVSTIPISERSLEDWQGMTREALILYCNAANIQSSGSTESLASALYNFHFLSSAEDQRFETRGPVSNRPSSVAAPVLLLFPFLLLLPVHHIQINTYLFRHWVFLVFYLLYFHLCLLHHRIIHLHRPSRMKLSLSLPIWYHHNNHRLLHLSFLWFQSKIVILTRIRFIHKHIYMFLLVLQTIKCQPFLHQFLRKFVVVSLLISIFCYQIMCLQKLGIRLQCPWIIQTLQLAHVLLSKMVQIRQKTRL